ncbi:MAG TPA: response regulator [Clostridia bacterium]|jgi:two-component system response regulator VicR|nr:response regulator transcription factor [Clostridiaceae bacterium]HNZ41325.1 response regulator [Clostridia bacterium]HOF26111.1 response regulator [Clostridia bacterium]HOM33904.1 response regulator [Clostridia bacterium]HOR89518.1 response regulator [Clostridia bacterium]
MGHKILVVDDEKNIVDILKYNLEKEGYDVICAYDGKEAIFQALKHKPDLILLDIMLPEYDGFVVCRKLRESTTVPIIMLSAKSEELDKVIGLEMGADDYMTKPFSARELIARVKSNLRRVSYANVDNSELLSFKIRDLEVDEGKCEVLKNGQVLELTAREFELLVFFMRNPEKVFSREFLLDKIWDYEYYGEMRTVDVTVSRLREKLSGDPNEYIVTKRGMGYYFKKD